MPAWGFFGRLLKVALKKYSYPAFFILLQIILIQLPLFTDLLLGAALTSSLFLGCFFCALLAIFWPNVTPRLVMLIPLAIIPLALLTVVITIQIFQAMGVADPGMREGYIPDLSMPVMEAMWKSALISGLVVPIIAMGLYIRKKADRLLTRIAATDREERAELHNIILKSEDMPELSIYKFERIQYFSLTYVISYHMDRLGFIQAIRLGDDLVIFNLAMRESKRKWSLGRHLLTRLLQRPEINDPTLQNYYFVLPGQSPVPVEIIQEMGFQAQEGESGREKLEYIRRGLNALFHEEFPEWNFFTPYELLFERVNAPKS